MRSKIRIAGHPIHPMLVAFPIAFYASTCVAYILFSLTTIPFWFQVGYLSNLAAVATAVLAAIPGFIDWAVGVPSRTAAKRTGFFHLILNVTGLALFSVCAWLNYDAFTLQATGTTGTVPLSLLGMAAALGAGYLGWTLIGTHHVGVDLTPEQETIDRARERSRVHHLDTEGSRRHKPIDTAM